MIILGLLAACSSQSAGRALVVQVRDEEGHALAGIGVEIDGVPATRTDDDGKARISLGGAGAARARLAVTCPQGSRESNPRHVARQAEGATARLELSFVCRPAQRMLAIVVRAEGGAGCVLRADGEPIGTVAADGTLHATVWRAPDSDLQLMLDNSALALRPRNPLREHRVADRDEVIVFDQPLQASATKSGSPKRAGRMKVVNGDFGGRR